MTKGDNYKDVIDKMGGREIPWLWSMIFIFYEIGFRQQFVHGLWVFKYAVFASTSIASDIFFCHFEESWWGIFHGLWVFIILGPYASKYYDYFLRKVEIVRFFHYVFVNNMLLIKYYICLFCYSLYIIYYSLM